MKKLTDMTREELESFLSSVRNEYVLCKSRGLKLDMSRGKPESAQISLSDELLSLPGDAGFMCDGIDVRNYGVLDGLPSCKALFADILSTQPKNVFIGGVASLNLMYDVISKAYTNGLYMSETPWGKLDKVKFLCPVPGYDRHFRISEVFGMELISVPMNADGPDMDTVERLALDPDVRGMWCTPKYANPTGIIYSDAVISRIAALKHTAPDFVLMWDNAYCVHEFDGDFVPFADILSECEKAGNPHMVFEFASTSKITFPGAGISCFACSDENMTYLKKYIGAEIISYDKVNQYRHVLFLKDKAHVLEHMKKHAAYLKPKFDAVADMLDERVAPYGFISYHKPEGGYFISLDTMPGCAKRTHALAREAGVVLTGAGATFPYGIDPEDKNLRIAPSYPPIEELCAASEVLCVCLKLAAAEKLCQVK